MRHFLFSDASHSPDYSQPTACPLSIHLALSLDTVSNQTQTTDLDSRLAEIDKQFVEQAMPIRLRPLEAFKLLHGSFPDGELRNSLFAPIAAWFTQQYGKRAEWDAVVARIPVLIRDNVYLLAVPFITGDAVLRFTDFIEDLPQEIAESMTPEEFKVWGERGMLITSAVHTIYNLSVDDVHLSGPERELLRRSLFDLENAATSLKTNEDTQGAIFNAHAAAEKFLKIGLKRAGVIAKRRSHKLDEIFKELVGLRSTYAWLESSVDALRALAPDMDIRYRTMPRTIQNALSAIYSALNLCGNLAQIWLFDLARGTEKSGFSPGCFYIDGRSANFYCDRLSTTVTGGCAAVLMAFDDSAPIGPLIAELVVDQDHSSLYLEVTDPHEITQWNTQFQALRQRCQKQIDPKDMGIGVHSSPEGSYVGGLMRLRGHKQ